MWYIDRALSICTALIVLGKSAERGCDTMRSYKMEDISGSKRIRFPFRVEIV